MTGNSGPPQRGSPPTGHKLGCLVRLVRHTVDCIVVLVVGGKIYAEMTGHENVLSELWHIQWFFWPIAIVHIGFVVKHGMKAARGWVKEIKNLIGLN